MQIIVGLGNPGSKYQDNRHNVGFMAADAIARRHSFSPWSKKFQAQIAEARLGDDKVLLIKPQTFMNLSGQAVGEAMRFFKLGPSDITVFYDELDLAPGRLRIKRGGGHGGHNGIRSIDEHCGKDYRRVRIGIGHPGPKELVNRHVLGDFAKADAEWLEPMLDAIGENAAMLVAGDENGFMNKVSLALKGRTPQDGVEPSRDAGRGQSHIRQARTARPSAPLPETGPMAAMLKKLFGRSE